MLKVNISQSGWLVQIVKVHGELGAWKPLNLHILDFQLILKYGVVFHLRKR